MDSLAPFGLALLTVVACRAAEDKRADPDGTRVLAPDAVPISLTTLDNVVLQLHLNASELRRLVVAHGYQKATAVPDCMAALSAHAAIGTLVFDVVGRAELPGADVRFAKIRMILDEIKKSPWQGECRLEEQPSDHDNVLDHFDASAWKRMVEVDFVAADKREHDLIAACEAAMAAAKPHPQ